MTIANSKSFTWGVVLIGALGTARPLEAQIGIGTWVRKTTAGMAGMTMVVQACCNGGRRLTYHIDVNGTKTLLTVESRFDGSEAPVLVDGKPSGETMAIKRVDAHNTSAVLKRKGKVFGTSKGTLSADEKTLTVVNDFTSSVGGQATEVWVRK